LVAILEQNNGPELWAAFLPKPAADGHKYDRGHLVLLGGARLTGAARLAAEAAMRIGAGLCSVVCEPSVLPVYQAALASHIMAEPLRNSFAHHLQDERRNAVLIGPGAGLDEPAVLRQEVLNVLATGKASVIDGDALSCFEDRADLFCERLHENCVLTPHQGEFARIFPDLAGERPQQAQEAAQRCGAVVVLKGAQTVIAAPDQGLIINDHASPYLATAGSGDVLAGMIGGLVAQGMSPYLAAAASVWLHGEAGLQGGPGLVAPDIIEKIPTLLNNYT